MDEMLTIEQNISDISQAIPPGEDILVFSVNGEIEDQLDKLGYKIISFPQYEGLSHQPILKSAEPCHKYENIIISQNVFMDNSSLSKSALLIAHQRSSLNSRIIVYKNKDCDMVFDSNRFKIIAQSNSIIHLKKVIKHPSIIIRSRWLATAKLLCNSLVEYFNNKQYQVHFIGGEYKQNNIIEETEGCKHIFAWNGTGDENFISDCKAMGIPVSFMEIGINYSTEQYFYICRKKCTIIEDILCHPLDWVPPEHMFQLEQFKKDFCKDNHWEGGGGYILCLLDSENNFIDNDSQFKNAQHFIDYVENLFPDKQIIFRMHPKDPSYRYFIAKKNTTDRGDLINLIRKADLVYGRSSSALFKSAILGAPTVSVYAGEISQKLLAAIIDRQISLDCFDLDDHLSKLGLHF